MEKKDLKLESASVRVSNANQTEKVYNIEANFNTYDHKLQRVDNGIVRKDNETYATFYKSYEGSQNTTTYTFYAQAASKETKAEIMELVEDFEAVAEAVALNECSECEA